MGKVIINAFSYPTYVVNKSIKDWAMTNEFKELAGKQVIKIETGTYFCPETEKFYGLIPQDCLIQAHTKGKEIEVWEEGTLALLKKDIENWDIHNVGLTAGMRDCIDNSIPIKIISSGVSYTNSHVLYRAKGLGGLDDDSFYDDSFYVTEEMFTVIPEEEKDKLLEQRRKEKEEAEAKRKEVLAELSADIKDELVEGLTKALEEREYSYTTEALSKIIEEWWIAKRDLIKLLSKHPQWNKEKFLIQFDTDMKRERDDDAVTSFVYWTLDRIEQLYQRELIDSPQYIQLRDITYRLCSMGMAGGKITPDDKDIFTVETLRIALLRPDKRDSVTDKDIKKFIPRVGQKLSRWVNKIFTTFFPEILNPEFIDIHERKYISNYEQIFAKFADAVNPLIVKRHTCLSLNPVDFLLQSHGNSWRSCHYIGDSPDDAGCYCSGTISYMLDGTSMVFYTVDGDYNGNEIEHEAKITRNMFAWNNGALLQQRIYPQKTDGDSDIYVRYRNIVQGIFAQILEQPNLWSTNHNARIYCKKGVGSTMYHDWEQQESSLSAISILNSSGYENKEENKIVIGAKPISVISGKLTGSTIVE